VLKADAPISVIIQVPGNHSPGYAAASGVGGGHPGVTVEEPDEGVAGGDIVLAGGGQVASDPGEAGGSGLGLEAGGDPSGAASRAAGRVRPGCCPYADVVALFPQVA